MLTFPRIVVSLLIGLIGCLFIWVAAPYNNFFLQNSFISDTYFPVAGVLFMLVIVLAVNPLLRLAGRSFTLNGRQLILIFIMLLAAAVVPSHGLLRMLPWSLAASNQRINEQERLSEVFIESGVPDDLFPDPIGFGVETPASDQFLDELEPDAAIPWESWLPLIPVWGSFLLACWLMMIGTGLVLFPEWKEKERLQFPLLDVYRSILPDTSGQDHLVPSMFRSRGFWIGAAAVLFIYAINGLNHHTHGAFPSFPMGWQLGPIFSEDPWRHLSRYVSNVNHIYFVLVGMAFFMPNRVGFSIWSFTVGYALFAMIQRTYFQPYYAGMVHDHRNGAMVAVTVMVLFISRHHWLHVGKVMFRGAADDADRMLRVSGWMIVVGAIGMFLWLRWANVPEIWAAVFVLIGFMVSVLIARIVAETGLPFVRITGMNAWYLMSLVPGGWVTGAAIYMSGFIAMIFQIGSRVSAAAMISHAAGLDRKATPKYQIRVGYMMIGILALGLVVGGAVHLYMGYTQPYTMDGSFAQINQWGTARLNQFENSLIRWSQDYWPMPANRLGHFLFGIAFAGALQIACSRSPRWPLHPVGLLLVGHYYGNTGWASILIGWTLKVSIINIGGATVFRKAQPIFMGLIMGEILSAVIWTLVPVILLLLGHDPGDVGHIPLLPT